MKVVNHLLSVHKFVVVSVIPVEVVVIALPFDPILKPSSIASGVQYIIDFPFVFIFYHYWPRGFILLARQRVVGGRAKQVRMKYIMNTHRLW